MPHEPKAALKTTVATNLKNKDETKETAKDAKAEAVGQTTLNVCNEMKKNGGFCDPKKKESVATFFGEKYTELKKKYAAY